MQERFLMLHGRHSKEAAGSPLRAGGFLVGLSIRKRSVPHNSTFYTTTLLLPKTGQEKTGFRCSRKDYCSGKNFLLGL